MWTFHIPVKIHFGIGSLAAELVPAVAGRRAAVVISKSVAKLETVKNVLEQLNPIAAFDAVQPNPTVANADAVADVLKESGAEVVVAIGGGSVLDAAKAAAFLAANNEKSIRPFHSEGKPVSGNSLPLIAVPTTAGTGSEVTPISVLDDEEKHIKAPISSPLFYPATAIVDPAVTIFVPLKTTAAAALDALSHCIEGYWSNNHQPICDTLAKEAAKIILTNFDKVIGNLQNLQSREQLSYAALVAGLAFQLPKNAVVHACSYPLSNRFHLAHGEACALTLEAAVRLNTPFMNGRMEEFVRYCGFETVEMFNEKITALKRRGGLPLTLSDAGITEGDIPLLTKESIHPLLKNNPKPLSENDLGKLYQEIL